MRTILFCFALFVSYALASIVATSSVGSLASANGLFRPIPLTFSSNGTAIVSTGDGFSFTLASAGTVQIDFTGTWTVLDCGTVGYKAFLAVFPVGSTLPAYINQLPGLSGNLASNPASTLVSFPAGSFRFAFSASCVNKASTLTGFTAKLTKL